MCDTLKAEYKTLCLFFGGTVMKSFDKEKFSNPVDGTTAPIKVGDTYFVPAFRSVFIVFD